MMSGNDTKWKGPVKAVEVPWIRTRHGKKRSFIRIPGTDKCYYQTSK